ncbi:MAG TPA: zinc-ribbon domain-containing protein [Clostridia bacterium]|nr:zinc-ribbon domain-containing protein [Clostridia bacterium]
MGLWGKDVARTRYVGQVYVDQLCSIKKESDVLQRIAPRCENCGNNEYYGIYETSRLFRVFNIPLVQCDTVYYFSCPECNFGFKLRSEEFKTLEQIASINTKYLEGLITKSEFESSLRSIQE